jgi:NNP family nitrate/nitrite transporter-like MFS transporter
MSMFNSAFLKAGHTPTLLAAFLYFDVAFMIWVMLGPLAVQIATSTWS